MDIVNASDAKREFGELLLKAQSAPVSIKKNGKPVAVMVSTAEYELLDSYRREHLKSAIANGMDDVENDRLVDGEAVFSRLKQM